MSIGGQVAPDFPGRDELVEEWKRPVRFFRQKLTLEDAVGSHTCSLQWHSSRVFTPLTGSHCKLRPNTEGQYGKKRSENLTKYLESKSDKTT
jgi:hypothetical protein